MDSSVHKAANSLAEWVQTFYTACHHLYIFHCVLYFVKDKCTKFCSLHNLIASFTSLTIQSFIHSWLTSLECVALFFFFFFFFSYACHEPKLVGHETASSSAECSRDKPPFSFVRGQDLTMWDIVWVSPQRHRSVSVSRHFLLQAPQWPCSVQKRFSRDHCCRGRSKPSCRIVGSHIRWELTTWADFQLCLHRLFMSTGCKSSHNGFLDVSRSN